MTAIVPVLIGAFFTAVVGNFLVQRWQMNNWREQQRQLGYQSEIAELKKLVSDITDRTSERYLAMFSLLNSLRPDSTADVEKHLEDYRVQVGIWNRSLNWLYVQIRIAVDYGEAIRFENEVHDSFRDAGEEIQRCVRNYRSSGSVGWADLSSCSESLNSAKTRSYEFLKDLVDTVEIRQHEIYFGKRLHYAPENLREFRLLDLVKSLFVARVDDFYVIRTP